MSSLVTGVLALVELVIGNESNKTEGFILRAFDKVLKMIADIVKS